MKKLETTLLAFSIMILLFAGCKKDEDEVVPETAVSGNWTIGTNSYKVAYSAKTTTSSGNTMFIFTDGPFNVATINSVSLTFKTAPTTSGTYQLVGIGTAPLGNQFNLSAGNSTLAYAYILPANVNVEVTMNASGKLKVVIPSTMLKSTSSGIADAAFTATLQEM
jgi:hypothetical protein